MLNRFSKPVRTLFQLAAMACSLTAHAGQSAADDAVEVALVLAVDVSSSVSDQERLFQREAYATALTDNRIARAALAGGGIAIGYFEWSGPSSQRILVPMRTIRTFEEMNAFAMQIRAIEDQIGDPMHYGTTAIGNALTAAATMLESHEGDAVYRVIDISGDGHSNAGHSVTHVRDNLVRAGITINGLPITRGNTAYHGPDVGLFYEHCVIGGAGAFHVVAGSWEVFRDTLMSKLVLEMAGHRLAPEERRYWASRAGTAPQGPAGLIPATLSLDLGASRQPSFDCEDPSRNAALSPSD
ncbi:Protein of unknown function [Poseidonocella pacifica]|uniref:VWFA domain-containing protein n=1 Tax=Poseidonocella pacifica TaxID=871651 RepID=A0A1I0VA73_9RHOB|nr:DUF1194 domain-containing protein [Poseidonocella pacifica]SFA72940.1 Protein of unknown function [Poseidonocella pacifica]